MRGYAAVFAVGAICSAAFIDSNVKTSVRVIGRASLAVCTVLFLASEAMAIFS